MTKVVDPSIFASPEELEKALKELYSLYPEQYELPNVNTLPTGTSTEHFCTWIDYTGVRESYFFCECGKKREKLK
jgi:hypothetical protein